MRIVARSKGVAGAVPDKGVLKKQLPSASQCELKRLQPQCSHSNDPDYFGARALPKVIVVVSANAGDGRTTVVTNLAAALGERNRIALLIDTASERPNLHRAMGLTRRGDLSGLLAGQCTIGEILIPGPHHTQILPSFTDGIRRLPLSVLEQAMIVWSADALQGRWDAVLMDTDAAADRKVLTLVRAAHHVVVVVCDSRASRRGTLALIERLSSEHGVHRFKVVTNRTPTRSGGYELYRRLLDASDALPNVVLEYAGAIPRDISIAHSSRARHSVVDLSPDGEATQAFRDLAVEIEGWSAPTNLRGQMEFFAEWLMKTHRA